MRLKQGYLILALYLFILNGISGFPVPKEKEASAKLPKDVLAKLNSSPDIMVIYETSIFRSRMFLEMQKSLISKGINEDLLKETAEIIGESLKDVPAKSLVVKKKPKNKSENKGLVILSDLSGVYDCSGKDPEYTCSLVIYVNLAFADADARKNLGKKKNYLLIQRSEPKKIKAMIGDIKSNPRAIEIFLDQLKKEIPLETQMTSFKPALKEKAKAYFTVSR